jgi:hypothetical protein
MLRYALIVVFAIILSGCATPFSHSSVASRPASWTARSIAWVKRPFWKREGKEASGLVPWQWATALPRDVPRGELVLTNIAHDVVARVAPEVHFSPVQTASYDDMACDARVINIGGQKVANFAELAAAEAAAVDQKGETQVDVAVSSNGQMQTVAINVDQAELHMLCNSVSPETRAIRVLEGGNPWVVVRDGAIRCKLMARAERVRGLLQVVVSLATSADVTTLQPYEVRASCDGKPLRCLTATDTIELLYGKSQPQDSTTPNEAMSFAAVSERDDYLIPTNYSIRAQAFEKQFSNSAAPQPRPALISGADESYPGTAILGDARALAAFLLQRQRLAPNERDATGWIMFAGEELKSGQVVEIEIDLATAGNKLQFTLPTNSMPNALAN